MRLSTQNPGQIAAAVVPPQRFAAFAPCRMQPLVRTGLYGRRMGQPSFLSQSAVTPCCGSGYPRIRRSRRLTLVGPYGGQDHGPGKRKRRGEHGSYQFAQGAHPLSTSRVRWDSGNRSGSPVKPSRFPPPSYTMFPSPATVLCLQRDRRPFRTGGSLENESRREDEKRQAQSKRSKLDSGISGYRRTH